MELYELKADDAPDDRRVDLGLLGSSSASLHAKTFTTDGKRVYAGSFNLDPRTVSLNTETGSAIESANLASDIHFRFEDGILPLAYAVTLDKDETMIWRETRPDGSVATYRQDPGTNAAERIAVTVIGWLPVQWLL